MPGGFRRACAPRLHGDHLTVRDDEPDQLILSLTAAVGPATAMLARRLIDSAIRDAYQSCLDLLRLAHRFAPPRVERAALHLIDYGVQDVAALRFLLAEGLDNLTGLRDADFDGQLHLCFGGRDGSQ